MTPDPPSLQAHYGRHDTLLSEILDALSASGHDIDALDPALLSGADEFHLGGRLATLVVLDSIRAEPAASVLDVGCGIGGVTRTIATELGTSVLGVDLTDSFVSAARELTARVGMADRVSFEVGDALALDQPDAQFDLVTLFHVGMNIGDKERLFAELARVVRPGGRVVTFDIMRTSPGDLTLPLPWASSSDHQHLAEAGDYLDALRLAGLEPDEPIDRRSTVAEAMRRAADDPPPVNLSHLMGADFAEMFTNLRIAFADGVVTPMQITAWKPS